MPIQTIGILSPGDMGQAIAPWMKSLQSFPMKQALAPDLEYFIDGVKSENL